MQNTTYVQVGRVMDTVGTMDEFEFLDFKYRTPRLHSLTASFPLNI